MICQVCKKEDSKIEGTIVVKCMKEDYEGPRYVSLALCYSCLKQLVPVLNAKIKEIKFKEVVK